MPHLPCTGQHLHLCFACTPLAPAQTRSLIEEDPNLVTSGKSRQVVIDDFPFSIEIYRLEKDRTWTLEVVDPERSRHVRDEQVAWDKAARDVASQEMQAEGAMAFMRGDNVIPFRRT